MKSIIFAVKKFRSAWRLPLREKLWIVFLYPISGVIRAALIVVPFRVLSRGFGQHRLNRTLSTLVSEPQKLLAWRIGRIVELTARYTPWESKCLVQAVMVRLMCRLYHIPYVLHIGALLTHNKDEPMKAHAWVKVGPWVVVGGDGHRAFAVVGSWVPPAWVL